MPCGLNGHGSQDYVCTQGVWFASGPCVDPDVCVDGDAKTAPCGLNGAGTEPALCVAGQ